MRGTQAVARSQDQTALTQAENAVQRAIANALTPMQAPATTSSNCPR